MVFWLEFAQWAYLVLWGVLLIHCLFKRKFFPLFGRGWGTKAFWLITFVFMNPLLTLLYVIFAVVFKAEEQNQRKILSGGAVCLVFALLVIAIDLRSKQQDISKDITTVRAGQEKKKEKGLGFHAQAGVLEANNSLGTTSVASEKPNARFCAKSIVIRSKSDHLLIDKVCRFMQKKIVELPYVDQVEYRPAGAVTDGPPSQADVTIVVGASDITEGGIGINHKFKATISCFAGTEPVGDSPLMHHSGAPPVVCFSMNGNLQHSSVFRGFESDKARYQQQSENIAQQFIEAITKEFNKWVEKDGLLPELPEYMYGREVDDVEFEFLKARDAKLLYHSRGLLKNYCAVWSYEDDREDDDALREVRDILREQGWSGGDKLDEQGKHKRTDLVMSKDQDHLQIFREKPPRIGGMVIHSDDSNSVKKLPIVVLYSSLFTSEQIDDVLGKLFASEVALETKLVFEDYRYSENVKQLLLDSVKSQQVETMNGFLMVGHYYVGRDEKDKATESLMMALAMARAESHHNPRSSEIKSLAKKIGDESLAKAEVGLEYYQRAGFIDMSTVPDSIEYECAVGEPLMLYLVPAGEEGTEQAKIKTVVLRINKAAGAEGRYELETITKQGGSSSTGKRGLTGDIALYDPTGNRQWFRLDVTELEGERFRLALRKE